MIVADVYHSDRPPRPSLGNQCFQEVSEEIKASLAATSGGQDDGGGFGSSHANLGVHRRAGNLIFTAQLLCTGQEEGRFCMSIHI